MVVVRYKHFTKTYFLSNRFQKVKNFIIWALACTRTHSRSLRYPRPLLTPNTVHTTIKHFQKICMQKDSLFKSFYDRFSFLCDFKHRTQNNKIFLIICWTKEQWNKINWKYFWVFYLFPVLVEILLLALHTFFVLFWEIT